MHWSFPLIRSYIIAHLPLRQVLTAAVMKLTKRNICHASAIRKGILCIARVHSNGDGGKEEARQEDKITDRNRMIGSYIV